MPNYGRRREAFDAQILRALREHPGLTFRGLRRVVGGSIPNLRHRLNELTLRAEISRDLDPGRHRYWRVGDARRFSHHELLSDPNLRRLLELLMELCEVKAGVPHRYVIQSDVCLNTRKWGWSRSTA